MHISGEVIVKLAAAARSLEDAKLSDAAPLFARNPSGEDVPILASDDEEADYPMTVGDLKAILAPFAAWF
jgi:hypothetical protein